MMRNCALSSAVLLLIAGCSPAPSLDDEAGVTTAMSESSAGTTEESAGTTTTSDEETSSGDQNFVLVDVPQPPPDCEMPVPQDCPEGEKCVVFDSTGGTTWNATKCVPIMGDQHAGESCWWGGYVDATDNCDATSMCWYAEEVEGAWVGTCFLYCQGTFDQAWCPPQSKCLIPQELALAICIPQCDPLVQDCAPGTACYWANTDFFCVYTALNIPTGESCVRGSINHCAPGNYCIDAAFLPSCAGAACCSAFCDLQLGDADCADQPSTACVSFFEIGTAPLGFEHIGLCMTPP